MNLASSFARVFRAFRFSSDFRAHSDRTGAAGRAGMVARVENTLAPTAQPWLDQGFIQKSRPLTTLNMIIISIGPMRRMFIMRFSTLGG